MTYKLSAAALASASLLALGMPAVAQMPTTTGTTAPEQGSTEKTAAPDAATSEIVVTAQRRTERVVDVPISITVANQAQLERQQVNTVSDLNRIAPSLEIQNAPGQNTGGGGAIRGIGTQTFNAGATASVGVVVDQVSQGNANVGDLFDVARIEVLKGPQGTLFGLTTSAGVINITTNAPDPNRFSARVRTELSAQGTAGSKLGNQIVQGVVNVPVSQDAAVRISGLLNRRQGVDRNAYTGDWNDINRYALRGRFLWQPTDRVTVNLIGDYAHSKQTGGGDFFTFIRADTANSAALRSCGVTAYVGNQDYCSRQKLDSSSRSYGGSLQLDYQADPFTLTSITALRRNFASQDAQNIFRADPLSLEIIAGPYSDASIKLFTQEFRLTSPGKSRLEYTIGGFYSRQLSDTPPSTFNVTARPFPGLVIPVVATRGAENDVTDRSVAVFGQATVHATDTLRLIAGGRYTDARLSLRNFDVASSATRYQNLKTDKFSYRAGVQYDVAPRTMAYATVSRGFKGGQISVPALPAQPFVLLPEVPQAYEAGVKTTLFGGWIMDLNAFYTKVQNFQAQQCTSDPVTAALSCVNRNIDGVKTRGAELNFFGRVNRNLSLNTGFIYTRATYPKNFIGTDGTNIGGGQLAYAPKYKLTMSGEYEQPVGDNFKAFLAGDTVWKSRLRFEANSVKASTYTPHWTVGGRLGARTADDRYQIAVFARNLFNVHEPVLLQSGFPAGGAANIGAIYGPQSFRQIGLSLDVKF